MMMISDNAGDDWRNDNCNSFWSFKGSKILQLMMVLQFMMVTMMDMTDRYVVSRWHLNFKTNSTLKSLFNWIRALSAYIYYFIMPFQITMDNCDMNVTCIGYLQCVF